MSVSLTNADHAILDLLTEGRCTQGYIVDETGLSRQQVHSRLNVLTAAGYVERVHASTALYELIEDPREEVPEGGGGGS
jgi:DNA-binding IclR family transcriptional regulator